MDSQKHARQQGQWYNTSYPSEPGPWQSNGQTSAVASRYRASDELNNLQVTNSHATARLDSTSVLRSPQRQPLRETSNWPTNGYELSGLGGPPGWMTPPSPMVSHSLYTASKGRENPQDPSREHGGHSPYFTQGQGLAAYHLPASPPIWDARPVDTNQAPFGAPGPYNTESFPTQDALYDEYIPSRNTDPDGREPEFRPGRRIRSSEGERQELDLRFKVETNHWQFFTEGRVFKVYWAAPRGSNAPQSEPEGSFFDCGPHVHAKIQRFVVVEPRHSQGYSNCLPISTNSGKGAAKKGLRQEEHTIVYTTAEAPPRLPSETHLHKEPIKVDPVDSSEKLDTLSRLNLGKPYPVEHNVKVCEVGEIKGRHKRTLLQYHRSEMSKNLNRRERYTE